MSAKRANMTKQSFNDLIAGKRVRDLPNPALPPKILKKTLRQVGAWVPQTIEERESVGASTPSFVERCIELADVPLKRFLPSDLRVMLGQQIAPEYLLPLALAYLEIHPELESEYCEFDLLAFTADQKPTFWRRNPELMAKMEIVLDGAIDKRRKSYMALKKWKASISKAKKSAAKRPSKSMVL